jgi:hypothetical protein
MPVPDIPQALLQDALPLEQRLYDQLAGLAATTERTIRLSAPDVEDRTLRAVFLRWFLLEAIPPAEELSITHLVIERAAIRGALDLEGTSFDLLLRFNACRFGATIKLSDATLIELEMTGGEAPEIVADRATFKGSLKLHEGITPPIPGPRIGRLNLCGAEIHGNLDLRGCALHLAPDAGNAARREGQPPLFADGVTVHGNALLSGGFTARGEVRLNGCTIERNLDCSGASLSNPGGYSLSAAGGHVKGSAYFCETMPWTTYARAFPFISEGSLRLEGATIDGDLDCTGGELTATAFLVGQDDPPATSDLYAIEADSMKVGADVKFDPRGDRPFIARGIVSLMNAQVGGDFTCRGAVFHFPGEETLSADGMAVEGTLFLEDAEIDGVLRFVQAKLKQGLYLSGAAFDTTRGCRRWTEGEANIAAIELGGPCCGIYARNAEVGGTFRFEQVTKIANADAQRNRLWLFIPGAKAAVIRDDEQSWVALDRLDVTGCEYQTFYSLSDTQTEWRLRELDRHYAWLNFGRWSRLKRFDWRIRFDPEGQLRAAVEYFKPQPYIQLAKTFRAAGYEAAAKNVLVRLERNKTRYGDLGIVTRLRRYLLDFFLRYGYSPFRPVLFVLFWAVVSAVLFQAGYDAGKVIATKDNKVDDAKVGTPSAANDSAKTGSTPENGAKAESKQAKQDPPIEFNAILFAIDTLVPIVDLNQKKSWTVAPLSSEARPPVANSTWGDAISRALRTFPNQCLATLLVFNTFFGWLMTTLFAAGVSGLLATGKDDS